MPASAVSPSPTTRNATAVYLLGCQAELRSIDATGFPPGVDALTASEAPRPEAYGDQMAKYFRLGKAPSLVIGSSNLRVVITRLTCPAGLPYVTAPIPYEEAFVVALHLTHSCIRAPNPLSQPLFARRITAVKPCWKRREANVRDQLKLETETVFGSKQAASASAPGHVRMGCFLRSENTACYWPASTRSNGLCVQPPIASLIAQPKLSSRDVGRLGQPAQFGIFSLQRHITSLLGRASPEGQC